MLKYAKQKHVKSLNKLFDTYCWFMYGKKYPFNEANLGLYIKDVIEFYYKDAKTKDVYIDNHRIVISYYIGNILHGRTIINPIARFFNELEIMNLKLVRLIKVMKYNDR